VFFISLHRVQTARGAHLASYLMATEGSSALEVKRKGLQVDHSPPSGAEVKSYTSTLPYVFMVQCLIN
jgi:hypothetical protein